LAEKIIWFHILAIFFIICVIFKSVINLYDLETCISCNFVVVIGKTWNVRRPCSRMRKRVQSMHVFNDTRVLVFTQGQDDSCLRLIIFFYSSCIILWNVSRTNLYVRKNVMICATSLNETFRIICAFRYAFHRITKLHARLI